MAVGKLDGDDPEEIAQAEALLVMLERVSSSRGGSERRHQDELLDEGLRGAFPASIPVAAGHFTSTEPPSNPLDMGCNTWTGRGRMPRWLVTATKGNKAKREDFSI